MVIIFLKLCSLLNILINYSIKNLYMYIIKYEKKHRKSS